MKSKIQIYHNPRCRKSREALHYLEENEIEHETVYYLKNPISTSTLKTLLKYLNLNAFALLRKNETLWKTEFANKEWTEEELITIMIQNPKLIERPIVVKNEKAVIARPLEKIEDLLNKD